MQVGTSKTKGFTISLQAAVYLRALAAGTLHATTKPIDNIRKYCQISLIWMNTF